MPRDLLLVRPTIAERPKCDDSITFRLPKELARYIHAFAKDAQVSVSEFMLASMENEIGRMLTYRISLYGDLMPLLEYVQRKQCQTMLAAIPERAHPVFRGTFR